MILLVIKAESECTAVILIRHPSVLSRSALLRTLVLALDAARWHLDQVRQGLRFVQGKRFASALLCECVAMIIHPQARLIALRVPLDVAETNARLLDLRDGRHAIRDDLLVLLQSPLALECKDRGLAIGLDEELVAREGNLMHERKVRRIQARHHFGDAAIARPGLERPAR
jgi:hypothetical protein